MSGDGTSSRPPTGSRNRTSAVRDQLLKGLVIPAHPLALNPSRKLDERRQRALSRYYLAAGAGGLAVGVHTTQFAIRRPEVGLLKPVLSLALEEAQRGRSSSNDVVLIGGVCGKTDQATREAALLRELGYDVGLLSLSAFQSERESRLIEHCRAVGEILPLFGFYLQPAVGGRALSYRFWREFVDIPEVVAIKVAPFNRYATLDVARALAESGRTDLALYTGNDDSIVPDLVTPLQFTSSTGEQATAPLRIVGGLLGHWAVWTRSAADLLERCHREVAAGWISAELLCLGAQVTDCNAAFFDAANQFAGCIPGIHELLRRQGILEGRGTLDPDEDLSPGQAEEIDRVCAAYPHLNDDQFVAERLDEWLR